MALQSNDLFVIQSQTDNKLYKLRLDDLIAEVEGGAGVNFKGDVDLNNPPVNSGVTLPAANGDLYIVESDAGTIDAGWVMQNGETTADAGDRIIYDGDNSNWILVTTGSSSTGTVKSVTGSFPIESDGNTITPVISITEARTTTAATGAADGKGTDGAVHRLAEADDVVHTTGTADPRAVVTADLLKATNEIVQGLSVAAGGVTTVTTTDADANGALTISPTSGNVVVELKTAEDDGSAFGVVSVATDSDIIAGTAGAGAVVDASQLAAAIADIPDEGVQSLTEGGTDIVTGALQIATDADNEVTIGVNEEVFVPFNFAALPDITA